MPVLHNDITTDARHVPVMVPWYDIANAPWWSSIAQAILTLGADADCAMRALRALRAVLAWETQDPRYAEIPSAEIVRISGKLPDAWLDGLTAECVDGARAALALVRELDRLTPEELAQVQEIMAAPLSSPRICLVRAAMYLAALGLIGDAQADEHDHAAGEACPDPTHCDCAPCAAEKAASAAPPIQVAPPTGFASSVAAALIRDAKKRCETGTCPIG